MQVSGEYLAKNGISTFACSETQKFGHVTFFWNGNRSGYFDAKLETYLEVGRFVRLFCTCDPGCWGVYLPVYLPHSLISGCP